MEISSRLRISVILNQAAGTAERQDGAALRDALESNFAKNGASATISFVTGPEIRHAAERALEANKRGEVDAVAIGGGDGSIRTVAAVLAGSDVPLGILPLGTRNHFARDLAIPLDLADAVALIASATTRLIDVGEVNGEIFINNSSIGFYPYLVIARRRRRNGHRLPKWAATILAVPDILRHMPVFRLRVCLEGWSEPCRSPFVFIGNNEYQITGRSLGRRERLERGELWIYVAKVQGWPSLLWRLLRSMLGVDHDGHDVRMVTARTAEITARRHHLLVACDGEVERMQPPLRYKTRPGALRVFARHAEA